MTVVHQLLSGAGPHDAITTEATLFREHFGRWGWTGSDYAFRRAPSAEARFAAATKLTASSRAGDVVLIHHSAGWPSLEWVLGLPNPKLLLYHNVTPPEWLFEHAPVVAAHCAAGRAQLHELTAACDVLSADSAFNGSELGVPGVEVLPLLLDPARLGTLEAHVDGGAGDLGFAGTGPAAPLVLFVGRLSPHKRQEEVIRVFAAYRRWRAPNARLVLVGDPISESYVEVLRQLADTLAPGAVTIESSIPDDRLSAYYREASVFLCLSEHEGFCIPVLEALRFGLPVVARPAGAVPETAGDAALWVEDRDPAVIAELMHLAVSDRDLAAELARRGQARVAAYDPAAIAGTLRRLVETAAACA